jgi:hypothetical protein
LAVTISVVGQAARRGLIPRVPVPERLIEDARDWIAGEYGQFVRTSRVETLDSRPELLLELHPAAEPVRIAADGEGRVTASADTSCAGPGYHTFVGRVLDRLGEELAISWSHEQETRPVPWVGARLPIADRAVVEREHLTLLGRILARALDLRGRGVTGIQVGTRPGAQFAFDGAIARHSGRATTPGWRGRPGRAPRRRHPSRWTDATDARYLLQRALVILWTEIRWRPPADDAERASMDEALTLLRRALPSDASLPYPWLEWAELIGLRGVADPIGDRVLARAKQAAREDRPRDLSGDRRRPVTSVHEGWALPIPGSFGERRTPEEWTGGERGRQVTIAATVTRRRTGCRVGGVVPGPGRRRPGDGSCTTRTARCGAGADDHRRQLGVEVAVLEGYSAVTGRGAAIRIAFDDPDDWRWAVELWRSLRPA